MEYKEIDGNIPITDAKAWQGLYMDADGWVVTCHDALNLCPEDEDEYPGMLGEVYINIWNTYEKWIKGECELDGSAMIYFPDQNFSDVVKFIEDVHCITIVHKVHDYTDPR